MNISHDQTTSDGSLLVEFDHIPNTQVKHSSSLSFSNISFLQKNVTQPRIPLSISPGSYIPNHFDFRSISEYSFTKDSLSHKIKADVCSLPSCMDNEMSSHLLEKNSCFSGHKNRMPSYVSISRAISGYADYNKYSSELKKNNSLIGNLTPLPPTSSSAITIGKKKSSDDQVDNFCSLPYESTQEKICLNTNSKSFLQKKIESLYGESFAENWKKSRLKTINSLRLNNTDEKTRSPSCPPNTEITTTETNNLITSFHKINSLDNTLGKIDDRITK